MSSLHFPYCFKYNYIKFNKKVLHRGIRDFTSFSKNIFKDNIQINLKYEIGK